MGGFTSRTKYHSNTAINPTSGAPLDPIEKLFSHIVISCATIWDSGSPGYRHIRLLLNVQESHA